MTVDEITELKKRIVELARASHCGIAYEECMVSCGGGEPQPAISIVVNPGDVAAAKIAEQLIEECKQRILAAWENEPAPEVAIR